MPKCPDCKDTGVIELLTSTKPCKCRTVKPVEAALSYLDEACFGTIAGCTLKQPVTVPLQHEAVPGMLEHSEEMVAAAGPDATFTMEVDCGGKIDTFTGLRKSDIDFIHACLRAGWTPERVRDHCNEMATHRKVNDAAKVREAEARALGGFTIDELDAASCQIAGELEEGMSTQDQVDVISRALVRLLVRSTIRKAMEPGGVLNPYADKGATGFFRDSEGWKHRNAAGKITKGTPIEFPGTGGIVSSPTGRLNKADGPEFFVPRQPEDRAFRKGIGFVASNAQCGKAEFFKRMYGGKPNLDIDCSQIELRMLAHLARKQEDRRNERSI